jgi:cysteinyl-tRNA synthetase
MITIGGRKMGKSYNNVIKLTEMFSGDHELLTQAFHPMTVRFFILQSHYRSTLDFSSEALVASEKAFKRLWEAYENLQQIGAGNASDSSDAELENKLLTWLNELEVFMDDDFSTPKVLANLFEMAPVINSLKDGLIPADSISSATIDLMKARFKVFMEDILGLQNPAGLMNEQLKGVMQLLIDLRKNSKAKKDYATSDKIRNQLQELGIVLKDDKDGSMSWNLL